MFRQVVTAGVIIAFGFMAAPLASAEEFDVEAAKALFETKCSRCHPTSRSLSKHKDGDGWSMTVKRMQGKNPAWLADPEAEVITEYLSKTQGK